eukprot:GEMP01019414.1.p1 GENE.GEMP01019414.1~~GEMP01019414.1.p1  ORF type:complete len:476 (+),score=96.07 GEMP01019414.1:192-1619(+)
MKCERDTSNMFVLMLRLLVVLSWCELTFAALRRTTLPAVSVDAFDNFLRRHYTLVVLHKPPGDSFKKEFEAAFAQIRGDNEIEDRGVLFATTDGIPQVNSDYYSGDEAIALPNIAIYQGGARKAWLVEPKPCQADAPTSLNNVSQVIDFVTARILPRLNPANYKPENYKSDAIIKGYLLTVDSTPMRQEYIDAFHGVMLHCWQQGSSSATFLFSLHTVRVAVDGIDPKITLQRRDGVEVEPFRDFNAPNLYFTLLQWVQKHARPKILAATPCTKDQFFNKHDIVMFVFNLPHKELVADTQHVDWGIFTVNDDTPMQPLLDRYGLDPTDSPVRGVAIEKIYGDTGMYGRTKANEKYVYTGMSVREAIEKFKAGQLARCGFCKKFEKQYLRLARRFAAARPLVHFGKMDVTQNDNRWYDFYSSPQLHLFPHNTTEPVYFDLSALGADNFDEWVKTHTSAMIPALLGGAPPAGGANEL